MLQKKTANPRDTGAVTIELTRPLRAQTRTRVAIADKNPVVRAGLADLIARDGRFDLAAPVPNGAQFLSLCENGSIDVGVIGWSLPDMKGGHLLAELATRKERARIIVYTGETGIDVLRQTVRLGARGFVSKSDEPSILIEAIATVARGRLSLPYIDLQSLSNDPMDQLTAREKELLAALANGWTNLQIGARTGISRNTVKYHLKNLYDKLGVSNRAMAVGLYLSTAYDGR